MKMKVAVIFFLTLCSGEVHAQLYNSGVFYVSSGTTFYNSGSFTNTSSASYQNDGAVYIGGNIINDQAALPAGIGTTLFNGTGAQTLGGAAAFRSLNNTINNAAGLVLTNRLAVGDGSGGTLSFTSGLITTGTAGQDVYFYPGSTYTGFDASHHIVGYVTKSGSTNFTFPIGNGTYTADFDLTGLSATADFRALYTGSGYGVYNNNGTLALNGVYDQEWWDINEVSGAALAQVTLRWNDARKPLNHTSPGGLVIAHFVGGAWQNAGGSSGTPAGSPTGTVGPSNSLPGFSPFTFGSITAPLPITLSDFTVTNNQDCQAYLSWTTSLEQNAAAFEIQQSTDGTNFSVVATVKAENQPSTYHKAVAQTAKQAFYRIVLVDFDGQVNYSGIAGLMLPCIPSDNRLSVYPNPVMAGSSLRIELTSPVSRGQAQLEVYDGNGKKVYTTNVMVNSGINGFTLPATRLTQGLYTVRVIGEGWSSDAVPVGCVGH
jgi:hypothetical protein